MTDISAQIFMPMGIGALFEICHAQIGHWLKSSCVRVQTPPEAPKSHLASIVLPVKFSGAKSPERVDAVGISPTASKVFAIDGADDGTRTRTAVGH